MATMTSAAVAPAGLRTALPARRSSAAGARVAVRATRTVARAAKVVTSATFDANWLKRDPTVFALGFVGWTVPSAIPIHAFGENSLFGLLTASIGEQMSHFPTGPGIDDKFWLYLITWHIGLFVTMLLGQVGVQGRKQGYW